MAESTTTSRPALSLELLLVVGGILTGIDRFLPAILMVPAAFGLLGAMQDPSGLRDRSAPGLYIHASAAFSVVPIVIMVIYLTLAKKAGAFNAL